MSLPRRGVGEQDLGEKGGVEGAVIGGPNLVRRSAIGGSRITAPRSQTPKSQSQRAQDLRKAAVAKLKARRAAPQEVTSEVGVGRARIEPRPPITLMSVLATGDARAVEKFLRENPSADLSEIKDDGSSVFMVAVEKEYLVVVEELLRRDVNINAKNKAGWNALMIAIDHGRDDIAASLLSTSGIDLGVFNGYGDTALMLALKDRRDELAFEILKRNENIGINKNNSGGDNALKTAIKNRRYDIVGEIAKREQLSAPSVNEIFELALSIEDARLVKEVLKRRGFRIFKIDLVFRLALSKNDLGLVRELLQRGDVDISLLLMLAIQSGNAKVTGEVLRGIGDNYKVLNSAKDERGNTALMSALKLKTTNGSAIAKSIMLKENIDFSVRNQAGETALIVALKNKQTGIAVDILRRRDVGINQSDGQGNTVLSIAIEQGLDAIVREILKRRDIDIYAAFAIALRKNNIILARGILLRDDIDFGNLLILAAQSGNVEIFREVLTKIGDDPRVISSARDSQGNTALMIALKHRNSDGNSMAEIILARRNIDYTVWSGEGDTALMIALRNKQYDLAKKILQKENVSINKYNLRKESALLIAIQVNNPLIVKEILNREDVSVDFGRYYYKGTLTALMYAAALDDIEMFRSIIGGIERGNPALNLPSKDGEKNTALIIAVNKKNKEMVESLIAKGVDINGVNGVGLSALLVALKLNTSDSIVIAEVLTRNKGIDLMPSNEEGDTALMIALKNRRYDLAANILRRRADININQINGDGDSAFTLAVKADSYDIVGEILRREKFDVNAAFGFALKSKDLKLAKEVLQIKGLNLGGLLILAAQNGNVEIFREVLTKIGDDPRVISSARDSQGNAALMIALKHRSSDGNSMAEIILARRNIDYTAWNGEDDTALMIALRNKQYELTKKILQKGNVSINKSNRRKESALSIAIQGDNPLIVKEILNREDVSVDFGRYYYKGTLTALMYAAALDDIAMFRSIIRRAQADNPALNLSSKGGGKNTVLIIAVNKENKEMVESLIAKGVDINGVNGAGLTALLVALKINTSDSIVIAEVLTRNKGIDLRPSNEEGDTALMIALKNRRYDLAANILRRRADININHANRIGDSAFTLAVKAGRYDIVGEILRRRREFNAKAAFEFVLKIKDLRLAKEILLRRKDLNLGELLILAVQSESVEIFREILSHAEDESVLLNTARDSMGNSALMIALKLKTSDSISIAKTILSKEDIDYSVWNKEGDTALMIALKTKQHDIAGAILEGRDVGINQSDRKGLNALAIAIKNGPVYSGVVEKILERDSVDASIGLILAIQNQDKVLVKELLIRENVVVDFEFYFEGFTSLMYAVKSGDFDIFGAVLLEVEKKYPAINLASKNVKKDTALILAAQADRPDMVSGLLSKRANPDAKNEYGLTALLIALSLNTENSLVIAHNLLEVEVDLSVYNHEGNTALMLALKNKQYEIAIKILVRKGNININKTNSRNDSALTIAIKQGVECKGIVDEILGIGGVKVTDALVLAIKAKNALLIYNILKRDNVDIDLSLSINGFTPLMYAVKIKNIEIIRALLTREEEVGLNLYSTGNLPLYHTALTLAVETGNIDIVKEILEKMAVNPNLRVRKRDGKYLDTPLMIAIRRGYIDIVEEILKRGDVILTTTNHSNKTALMLAEELGNIDIIRAIFRRKDSHNLLGLDNNTLLMIAINLKNQDMIRMVLSGGRANLVGVNRHNETALILAAKKGSYNVVRDILHNKGDSNLQKIGGNKALAIAADKGFLKTVKILINTGVKPENVPDILLNAVRKKRVDVIIEILKGRSVSQLRKMKANAALEIAVKSGCLEATKILLDAGVKSEDVPNILLMAVNINHIGIVGEILHGKSTRHLRRMKANEALRIAVGKNQLKITEMLLNVGVKPEEIPDILMIAVGNNSPGMVRKLLAGKNSGDLQKMNVHNALLFAVEKGYLKTTKAILEAGVNAGNVMNVGGKTPLSMAVKSDRYDIVKELLKHGSQVSELEEELSVAEKIGTSKKLLGIGVGIFTVAAIVGGVALAGLFPPAIVPAAIAYEVAIGSFITAGVAAISSIFPIVNIILKKSKTKSLREAISMVKKINKEIKAMAKRELEQPEQLEQPKTPGIEVGTIFDKEYDEVYAGQEGLPTSSAYVPEDVVEVVVVEDEEGELKIPEYVIGDEDVWTHEEGRRRRGQ